MSEVSNAQNAASADDNAPTIFDKLLSGDIPSTVIYQDDVAFCFQDVNPQAPFHALVIPKERDGLTQLIKMQESQKEKIGHLMWVAQKVGQQHCPDGFRLVVNDGKEGAQSVYHLHIHILGGRQMQWPPG
jgi:histidine triad (HIT) family protein